MIIEAQIVSALALYIVGTVIPITLSDLIGLDKRSRTVRAAAMVFWPAFFVYVTFDVMRSILKPALREYFK